MTLTCPFTTAVRNCKSNRSATRSAYRVDANFAADGLGFISLALVTGKATDLVVSDVLDFFKGSGT